MDALNAVVLFSVGRHCNAVFYIRTAKLVLVSSTILVCVLMDAANFNLRVFAILGRIDAEIIWKLRLSRCSSL